MPKSLLKIQWFREPTRFWEVGKASQRQFNQTERLSDFGINLKENWLSIINWIATRVNVNEKAVRTLKLG